MPVFVHLTGLMNLKFLSHWIVSEDATKRFLGWDLSKGNQKLGKSSNISLRKPSNLPLCKIRIREGVWSGRLHPRMSEMQCREM